MQGIEDGFVASEGPSMAADNPAILPIFQPVGICPDQGVFRVGADPCNTAT